VHKLRRFLILKKHRRKRKQKLLFYCTNNGPPDILIGCSHCLIELSMSRVITYLLQVKNRRLVDLRFIFRLFKCFSPFLMLTRRWYASNIVSFTSRSQLKPLRSYFFMLKTEMNKLKLKWEVSFKQLFLRIFLIWYVTTKRFN
jgi:hypothetical protein